MSTRAIQFREKHVGQGEGMLSSIALRIVLVVCIIATMVLYVLRISAVSTKGYEISQFQSQIEDLQRENEHLDSEIAQYRSMQSIQDRMKGMDLVFADDPSYIAAGSGTVARR